MPVFQVGVIISKTALNDVIVRVEASTEKEARQLALKEVARRVDDPHARSDDAFGLDSKAEWVDTPDYGWEGISENDYSDTSPKGYPRADIDLTAKAAREGGPNSGDAQ